MAWAHVRRLRALRISQPTARQDLPAPSATLSACDRRHRLLIERGLERPSLIAPSIQVEGSLLPKATIIGTEVMSRGALEL
jgi:hypothetical protein